MDKQREKERLVAVLGGISRDGMGEFVSEYLTSFLGFCYCMFLSHHLSFWFCILIFLRIFTRCW